MTEEGQPEQHFPLPFQWEADGFVAPYVRTTDDDLAELVRYIQHETDYAALLTDNDGGERGMICDLGCGNGCVLRILCRALRCPGLGIDLDEVLISEAVAAASGESGPRLHFVHGDMAGMLPAQWRDVTMLYVYLLPEAHDIIERCVAEKRDAGRPLRLVVSNRWPLLFMHRFPEYSLRRCGSHMHLYELLSADDIVCAAARTTS